VGGRLGEVLGWAGLAVLVGGGILALEALAGLDGSYASQRELARIVGAAVLGALLSVVVVLVGTINIEAPPEKGPGRGQFLFRAAVAVAGLVLVWAAFPTRYLDPDAVLGAGRVFPEVGVELWVAVSLVSLGWLLLLSAPLTLQVRRWLRALLGLGAGALAVVLAMTLTPALARLLLVEHATAGAGHEPAPVPADVTRLGWTWQPEQPVLDMEIGPLGPIARFEDGFVGLDGETGEELWSYRRPYAREGEFGYFAGDEGHVRLLHQVRPDQDPTLVVLETATGEVVRDAVMPELGEDGPRHHSYLTPEGRFFLEHEDGWAVVTAYATDSTERLWEFPLEDTPEGRFCLHANDDGMSGHGDRLLVTRVCLNEEHVPEKDRAFGASNIDVPDDALETLIALDTATGEELWRREGKPGKPMMLRSAGIRPGPEGLGGGAVVVTGHGDFDLETGEQVHRPGESAEIHGEWAEDPDLQMSGTLVFDSTGAVSIRSGEERTALVLETDEKGEAIRQTEVVVHGSYHHLTASVPLAEALVSSVDPGSKLHELSESDDERVLLVVPLGGEVADEDLRWIRFDGGTHVDPNDVEHRVLAAPGAVVSYFLDPEETADRPLPVHGLVP
jgi:hypothetical protein